MNRLQQRLRSDEGFTLIELLVVMIIIGILIAIAVPSYLAFQGTAQTTKAQADVRAAIPDAEEFFATNNTYLNMTPTALKALDPGLGSDVVVYGASATAYCLFAASANGTTKIYYAGPGGGSAGGVTKAKPTDASCASAP